MHRRSLLAVACAAAGVSATAILLGQSTSQPQPVFRSGSVTIPVHATVMDASHRLITDLNRESFTIADDSGVLPITSFERRVMPLSVLLMLDASHSMRESIGVLRAAAKQFVAHMRPDDFIEIGSFHRDISIVRPFTNNQATLNRTLDFFSSKRVDYGTALWPAICEGLKELGTVDRRRVLVVFSDGENNVGKFTDCPITLQAVANDTMIYAIALRTEYGGILGLLRSKSVLDPILPTVVDESGGGYFVLERTDDLASTFARVAEELHHQYFLGFEAPILDGQTHPITVRVSGEGLTARARRSYLAQGPK